MTTPERLQQVAIKHVLRHRIAYKLEGDICAFLEEELKGYKRGEEGSRFDGGYEADLDSDLDKMLTIEIKSLETSLRRATARRHRHWHANISGNLIQCLSDLFCIIFCGLRNANYIALRPAIQNVHGGTKRNHVLKTYSSSQTAQALCNTVPPPLWPRMLDVDNLTAVLEMLRRERLSRNMTDFSLDNGDFAIELRANVSVQGGGSHETGSYTSENLHSVQDHQSHVLVQDLATQLSSDPSLGLGIVAPRLMPLTADFLLTGPGLGAGIFVELKRQKCHFLEAKKKKMMGIKHLHAHMPESAPIFVAAAGRWTYLLTELCSYDDGSGAMDMDMPAHMLFLHRSRIPESWWYSKAPDGWLYGDVPRNCIIKMAGNVAGQMLAILLRDHALDLGVPKLEDLSSVDPARLVNHIDMEDINASDELGLEFDKDGLCLIKDGGEFPEDRFLAEQNVPLDEAVPQEESNQSLKVGRRTSTRKDKDAKVLGENIDIALNNVDAEYALSDFPVLAQRRGIYVHGEQYNKLREIPPVVNAAIALSLTACEAGRGMILWQRKDRERLNQVDSSIPDLVYWDLYWTEQEKVQFRSMTYDDQRDYLNADTQLHDRCVVLPFVLDFPGPRQDKSKDARVITSASLKFGAISIPGRAYIGWVKDMVPDDATDQARRHVKSSEKAKVSYYTLDKDQRVATRVSNLDEMYQEILAMWLEPQEGARVFYKAIIELLRTTAH